jgi:hypothetical protein
LGEKIKISLIYFDITLFSYKNIFRISFRLNDFWLSYGHWSYIFCSNFKLSLFSPFYLNLPKVDFFLYVFVWKQSYIRYIKELNEDIKLRYIVVLGDGWDDASILCIWLKWNLNKLGIFLFSPPREIFPVIYVQFLHKRPFTDLL